MSTRSKFEFRADAFKGFVDRLQDLSQISDTVKLKFDGRHMLAYSLVASDTAVLCLKAFFMTTPDYLSGFESELCHDLVIPSAPRFVKNLRFFEGPGPIRSEMTHKPAYDNESVMHVRSIGLSTPAKKGDRLRINMVGGELSKIRDLDRSALEKRMSPDRSMWSFLMSRDDLASVRRLASINSDERTITISVEDGVVYLGEEGRWRLQVAETQQRDSKLTFAKKYLSHFDQDADEVSLGIFETFILVSAGDSRLLLSFETDFTNDDRT
jgi:hypothetical protein